MAENVKPVVGERQEREFPRTENGTIQGDEAQMQAVGTTSVNPSVVYFKSGGADCRAHFCCPLNTGLFPVVVTSRDGNGNR